MRPRTDRTAVKLFKLAFILFVYNFGNSHALLFLNILDLLFVPDLVLPFDSGEKPPLPLLVHFGPGSDPVDADEQQLPWLQLVQKLVELPADDLEHFLLGLGFVVVAGDAAGVDDAVHVDVEVVDLRVVRLQVGRVGGGVKGQFAQDFGIAHREVSEECWNTHFIL